MEEKKNKKQTIIIVIAVIAVIALLIGATTAYFLARQQSSEKTITTGTVGIKYTDNKDTVTIDNIIPIYDSEIKTKANKFSFNIENLGNETTYVDMSLTDITIDESLKDLEFKWALYSGDEKISNGNFRNITNNEILLTKNIELANSANKDYQLYIWISENDLDQSDMMGATFTGKITVEGNQEKSTDLLSTVIKNNNSPIVEEEPDFSTVATTDEGLIKGVDDDGETYYFRGDVEDNYVKIGDLKWNNTRYMNYVNIETANSDCDNKYNVYGFSSAEECKEDVLIRGHAFGEDMLWRIVRVNGDGTIRLIADGEVGNSVFNTSSRNEKYVGYTYDNSAPNVQDGTSSTIKTYLENWYTTNMSEYDNIIASARYCNDTTVSSSSITGSTKYYGASGRLVDNKTPQFTCPNTEKTYGGEYDLKIGLLTADEVAFAGGNWDYSNTDYYLQKWNSYLLGSPYRFNGLSAYKFYVNQDGYLGYDGDDKAMPVLNLRSDVLYSSGDGTKASPYIVNLDSI